MKIKKIGGILCLAIAVCLFFWQMSYLFIRRIYQMEYVYNHLFYIINSIIVIFLGLALWLIYRFSKKQTITGISVIILLIFIQTIFVFYNQSKVNTIRSLSPDSKNTLLIKENIQTWETYYYRVYYQLFARKMETLPYRTKGQFTVKWLADDVAAVTYKAEDDSIHQYIGTYGYRGDPNYINVGPSLSGKWESDSANILVNPEGIYITVDGDSTHYDWDEIVQFGTLAIVLVKNNQANWTISLDKDFNDHSYNFLTKSGHITLYKADFNQQKPIRLQYVPE